MCRSIVALSTFNRGVQYEVAIYIPHINEEGYLKNFWLVRNLVYLCIMKNEYIEAVETMIREGKLFIIVEYKTISNGYGPAKVIGSEEQSKVVKSLIKRELEMRLKKIPKFIRLIFNIKI